MSPHALIDRLQAYGFVVTFDGTDYWAPCPCCQFWLTDRPHPKPPADRAPADDEPCFKFREWKNGHVWARCAAGCDRDWLYGLVGSSYHASQTKPCRATTYCLDLNRGITEVQQTALSKLLDML